MTKRRSCAAPRRQPWERLASPPTVTRRSPTGSSMPSGSRVWPCSRRQRSSASLSAVATGQDGVPPTLLGALNNENEDVRETAAKALGAVVAGYRERRAGVRRE